MNAKHGYAGAVLLVLLAGPTVQAQMPSNLPLVNDPGNVTLPVDVPSSGLPQTGHPLPHPLQNSYMQPTALENTYMQPAPPPNPNAAMPPTPLQAPPASTPSGTAAPGAYPPAPAPTSPLQTLAPGRLGIYQQAQPTSQQVPPICCGPLGGNGPIGTEIYVQSGPNFLLSNSNFARSLHTGYEVGLVGRTLFFNQDGTKDSNILLDLNYIYNDGIPTNTFTYSAENLVTNKVSIRNLDRSTVGLGFGRDWFLRGSGKVGYATGTNWSVGVDGGARYGSSHVDMNIVNDPGSYQRTQHIYGEGFGGFRMNLEVPMGGWTWISGLRAEYSYSSLHVLTNDQNTGLHNINLLLTTGVRY